MNDGNRREEHRHDDRQNHHLGMYVRFAAMILTAMVVMYAVMFVSSYEWSHIRWSASRMFMTMTMGGTMGLVMLAWMANMYKNTAANVVVIAGSLLLLAVGVYLDRSQVTVGDVTFMNAMIPHHSMAITRSERANFDDVRVCDLAVEISEAQRREILEMSWLVEDIRENGIVTTREESVGRSVPDFERPAELECPPG